LEYIKREKSLNNKYNITIDDLTKENYLYYKEIEHQIGRLYHIYQVMRYIKKFNIPGDFIEFGVYCGFSLIWLARLRNLLGLSNRKVIGIDSFKGLPISTKFWTSGDFSDTSKDIVEEEIQKNLTESERDNIIIIESWFDDETLPKKLNDETNSLALIHIDCDLKVSSDTVLSLIEPYLSGTQYLLFDDWGITDEEIPSSFFEWLLKHPEIKLKLFSQTGITKYYEIQS